MTAPTQPLAADITAGLRRLKLSAMRSIAPELLITAKTQRWTPEDFLRTLVEAEITSRDASNARARHKAANFPVTKRLEEFDIAVSSIPAATFDYLASLEWIAATENPVIVADQVDGHPLSEGDGPFRLVVIGDKRAARAARNIQTLQLITPP